MKSRFLLLVAMSMMGREILFGWAAEHASFTPPVYTIYRPSAPLKLDGKLDDPAWQRAPIIRQFHFTWFEAGRKETTTAQMLWDDEFLYVAHVCQDRWITARCTEHDGPVARDDCFEVMLAPNVERPHVYFNVEWNVIGAWVDNHRPHGPDRPRAAKWDAVGVKVFGVWQGTLNEDADEDDSWTCEVAIPLKNFQGYAKHTPPLPGERWNLNLNRHGGNTNLQYSQWSPANTPRPSFHTPDRFGQVIFSPRTGKVGRGD